VSDSPPGTTDRIRDFAKGADLIDLSRIDADASAAGNQSFSFIGSAAFDGKAGELRFDTSMVLTRVLADVDGDAAADLEIRLDGSVQLVSADFVL
jgi:hypothetical protein